MFLHHVAWLYMYKIWDVVLFSFFILLLYLTCVCCCTSFNVWSEAIWKCLRGLCYFPLINFFYLFFQAWQISDQLSHIPHIYPIYICICLYTYIHNIQCIYRKCTCILHITYGFIALGLESLQYFEPICHPICLFKVNKITCLYFVVPPLFRLSLRIWYSAISDPRFWKSESWLISEAQLQKAMSCKQMHICN